MRLPRATRPALPSRFRILDLTPPRSLIILSALFALFFPSSIGGVISPNLNRLAIVLNALLLGAILLAGCVGTRVQVAIGTLIMGWLAAVTVFSADTRVSVGVTLVFAGLGMLYMLDIRAVRGGAPARWTMAFINVFVIAVGLGLSLNVDVANRFIKTFYSSFYPDLLVAMLDWYHKPVLTFATHSTAGFFFYLFFYLNLRRFRSTGSIVSLGLTLAILLLGFNVRSTTSTVLMALASVQVVWGLLRRRRLWRGVATALALVLTVGLLVLGAGSTKPYADSVIRMIRGNREAGLGSRFSEGGTLAGNVRYLRDNPLSPIGLTYGPESLFYGDSGIVLVLLRGSVPLLLLTYLGFGYLLVRNLRNWRDALWLFVVTCAFEIGYTPLQLFRFTAFLPFLMVYLNDLPEEDPSERSTQGLAAGTASRDPTEDIHVAALAPGANG
jgi:hypothetical protein